MIRNKNEVDSEVGYLRVQGAGCSPWSVLIGVPGHTGHSSPVNIYYCREWQHQSLRPAQPGPAWRPSPNPRPLIKAAARRAGHCAGPRQHQVTTTLQYHITHWHHYPELVSHLDCNQCNDLCCKDHERENAFYWRRIPNVELYCWASCQVKN